MGKAEKMSTNSTNLLLPEKPAATKKMGLPKNLNWRIGRKKQQRPGKARRQMKKLKPKPGKAVYNAKSMQLHAKGGANPERVSSGTARTKPSISTSAVRP